MESADEAAAADQRPPQVAVTGEKSSGGEFVAGDHHRLLGPRVEWAIDADDPAGIWRVVVVYNDGSAGSDDNRTNKLTTPTMATTIEERAVE